MRFTVEGSKHVDKEPNQIYWVVKSVFLKPFLIFLSQYPPMLPPLFSYFPFQIQVFFLSHPLSFSSLKPFIIFSYVFIS
jgi:hypothetical protein